jgi:hypothetical protein
MLMRNALHSTTCTISKSPHWSLNPFAGLLALEVSITVETGTWIELSGTNLAKFRSWLAVAAAEARIRPQRYQKGLLWGLTPGGHTEQGPEWNEGYAQLTGTLGLHGLVATPTEHSFSATLVTDAPIIAFRFEVVPKDESIRVMLDTLEQHDAVKLLLNTLVDAMDAKWPEAGTLQIVEGSGTRRGRRSEWHVEVRKQVVRGYLERRKRDPELTPEAHCNELQDVMNIDIAARTLTDWVKKLEGKP